MKKLISILLCIILFCVMVSGCERIPDIESVEDITDKPLRLCVDFGDSRPVDMTKDEVMKSTLKSLELYYKAGEGGPEKIEYEIIPSTGTARKTALTRIRTEIMAGGGPDVFIAFCPDSEDAIQGLFPFPEKAMATGYFLPLDGYMKNAHFMDLELLEPSVMAAGQYDGKQMLLPMLFDLPTTFYRLSEAQGYDGDTTWNDMVITDDPVLAGAATPVFRGESLFNEIWFPFVFGDYVDYEKDTLLITEDELLQRLKEVQKAKKNQAAGEAPDHYAKTVSSRATFGLGYASGGPRQEWNKGIGYESDVTIVPVYNTEGGTTAMIHAFAAVNRNTIQPNNAFFVAEYFLSVAVQGTSGFYSGLVFHSMITNTEHVKDVASEAQGKEFGRVLDQISCVRYWTPLDEELASLIRRCGRKGWDEEEMRKLVSESYTKMQMMLAES